MITTITRVFLLCSLMFTGSLAAQDFNRFHFQKDYEQEAKVLQKSIPKGSPEQHAQKLLRMYEAGQDVNLHLNAWGIALAKQKDPALATAIFDELAKDTSLAGATLRAELLLAIAGGDPGRQYHWKGSLPDPLAEHAAALLDHPDAFVRALADWALLTHVQLDDLRTHPQPIHPRPDNPAWYQRWLKVSARDRIIHDPIFQVYVFEQHRSPADLLTAAQDLVGKMDAAAAHYKDREKLSPVMVEKGRAAHALQAELRQGVEAGSLDLAAARKLWLQVRQAIRETVLQSPDLDFEEMLFVERYTTHNRSNITQNIHPFHVKPGSDLIVKKWRDPEDEGRRLVGDRLGLSAIHSIDLWFDADRVAFSCVKYPEALLHPDRREDTKFANRVGYFLKELENNRNHIYEVRLDGTELRQITPTHPEANDVEPCYLPSGDLMFASQRNYINSACSNTGNMVTNLFYIRADGTGIKSYGANKDYDRYPHMLSDGRVVYLHWEYQERSYKPAHTLWGIRPDGTGADAVFNQHLNEPNAFRQACAVPGSDTKLAAIGNGHYYNEEGALVLIDISLGINEVAAFKNVSVGGTETNPADAVPEGGVIERGGWYSDPHPLSDKTFLTTFSYDRPLHLGDRKAIGYGIYFVDVWGNKELIYRDGTYSSRFPHAVVPRPKPPVLRDTTDPNRTDAVLFLSDVYEGAPEIEPGSVKYLRISHRPGWPALLPGDDPATAPKRSITGFAGNATSMSFGYWTWSPTRVIGTVPVHEDGSAAFHVPVNMPLYFQALDDKHREIRRMRTSAFFQPGENRGCVGCHETRNTTGPPAMNLTSLAMKEAPAWPKEPPFGDTEFVNFEDHIQPILDRNCASCHNPDDAAGKLDLSRTKRVDGFLQSYRGLFGLTADDPTPRVSDAFRDLYQAVGYESETQPDYQCLITEDMADLRKGKEGFGLLVKMAEGEFPGVLVSISNKRADAGVTPAYAYGARKSRLTNILLEDELHQEKVQLTEDEWVTLVTWIEANAPYRGTFLNMDATPTQELRLELAPPFEKQTPTNMWRLPDGEQSASLE